MGCVVTTIASASRSCWDRPGSSASSPALMLEIPSSVTAFLVGQLGLKEGHPSRVILIIKMVSAYGISP